MDRGGRREAPAGEAEGEGGAPAGDLEKQGLCQEGGRAPWPEGGLQEGHPETAPGPQDARPAPGPTAGGP